MKIATYNLASRKPSRDQWPKVIEDIKPDIFLAQESREPSKYVRSLLQADFSTSAVWSPIRNLERGAAIYVAGHEFRQIELPDFVGNVIGVEVDGIDLPNQNASKLQVFCLQVPKRPQCSYSDVAIKILNMIADVRGDNDIVIGGDFNLTLSKRHEAEEMRDKPEQLAVQERLHDDFGLINCWQTANPGKTLAQTLRFVGDTASPFHCDGIFVPSAWADKLRSCTVLNGPDWIGLSDHNPVVAEFD